MKQNLLKTWLMLVCLLVGVGTSWADSETTTFTNKDWAPWTNVTSGSSFESNSPARGVANNGVNGACKSTNSYSNVTKIEVVCSSNTTGGKVAISIGSQQIADKSVANSNNQTLTFDANDYPNIATLSGQIALNVTKPSTKTVYVKSVNITTSTGSLAPVDASWSVNPASVSVTASKTTTATITTNYNGTLSVSSNNSEIATATISGKTITVKGVSEGSTTLTVTGAATSAYNAISKTINVTVSANNRPANEIFYESFDTNDGTGGNDGQWSGSIASSKFKSDNIGWDTSSANGANKCAKFGTGSALGKAKTPALGVACNIKVTFKAAAWNSSNESTTLKVSANSLNGNSKDTKTVTLEKGEWTTYELTFENLTTYSTIEFEGKNTSNSRFFLDEVSVVKTGEAKTLDHITVTGAKSLYKVGDTFSTEGMTVTAYYDEEGTDSKTISTGYTVSKTTALTTDDNTITISYTEGEVTKTADVTINVVALDHIAITTAPTTTTYTEGQDFDKTGMVVTATWGTTAPNVIEETIEDYTVTDGNGLAADKESVTISYTHEGTTKTITQTVTVTELPKYTLTIIQPTEGGILTVSDTNGTLTSGARILYGTKLTCEVTDIPAGKRFSRFYFTYDDGQNKYKATNPATFDELPTEGFTEATITVTYKDIQYYTINYMINGVNTNPQENIEENTVLTFPTAPATIGDKTFCGWIEEAINQPVADKPTIITTTGLTAKANKTYYAVYASKSGESDPNILTSVSGAITSGDYYLVDTYDGVDKDGNTAPRFWAVNGGLNGSGGTSGGFTSKDVSTYATEENGNLSLNLTGVASTDWPTLYTVTVTVDGVSISKGTETYYCAVGTNSINADMKTTAEDNISWSRLAEGTDGYAGRYSIEVDFPSDTKMKRCLLFQEHTASANMNRLFKNQTIASRGAGGNATNVASFSSGYFYFLQAGAATYSDFTTTPLGTGTITVSYGGYDEPTEAYYATYYTDHCVTVPEGCEAASVDVKDNKMYLTYTWTAGKVIPANTGVVIKADAAGTYTYPIGSEKDATAVVGTNYLKGSITASTTVAPEAGDYKFYKLAKATDSAVIGFYWGAENGAAFNSGANKAYLAVPAEVAASIKGFAFGEADDATAIFETATDTNADNTLYNLNGQRVSKAQKGIYIVNGKKVMFK